MNENYAHPDMPEGAAEGIIKGMYLLKDAGKAKKGELRVQLMGSRHDPARSHRRGGAAGQGLRRHRRHLVLPQLHRTGPRRRRRHPRQPPQPGSTGRRASRTSPRCWKAAAARRSPPPTTCARMPNQIREFVPMKYTVLGTDGFGRSDTRANLRRHFEVDRYYIAHAAIAALAAEGKMTAQGCGPGDQAVQAGWGEAESDWGLNQLTLLQTEGRPKGRLLVCGAPLPTADSNGQIRIARARCACSTRLSVLTSKAPR